MRLRDPSFPDAALPALRLEPSSDDVRFAELRDQVAARLRKVCADLPPDAFEALLRDICAMKLRWEANERRGL